MSERTDERLLTVPEVAEQLHVSKSTIERYIRLGVIRPDVGSLEIRRGRSGERRKFKQETVDAIAEQFKPLGWGECRTNDDMMTTVGVAEYLHVAVATVQKYVRMELIKPDVVMPSVSNTRSGVRKFKKETVDDLRDRLDEAGWRISKVRKQQ